MRVCSYSRERPSWLVKMSAVSTPRSLSMPTVRMKRRASLTALTVLLYCSFMDGVITWPRPQSRGECRSARPEESEARR